MDLALTNVLTVSVSAAQAGIGKYNTSNIAIFSRETFGGDFGDLGYKIYLDPSGVITDFGTDSVTAAMAIAMFSQQPNLLAGGGYLVVIPFSDADESIESAIVRTKDLVQYFGITIAEMSLQGDVLGAAAVVQTLNKIAFWPSLDAADVAPGGTIDQLRTGTLKQNRGIFYGSSDEIDCLAMVAGYAGRALSTNFEGSNTTQTMHLKDLIDVQPDPSMTQTLLAQCQAAGADVYISLQGVPKVFTSGANGFFDDVYNLQWFVGAITVAGFNVLAETSTKIVQTESGMDILKGAYRQVCEQAVANQYSAPGAWNSPNTFGNQNDFLRNIQERGYYIYSSPVALQSQASRAARQAPLVQLAIKEAGAVHSANIVIYVNQ